MKNETLARQLFDAVKDRMADTMPETFEYELKEVLKNNSVFLPAILVGRGDIICTAYIDSALSRLNANVSTISGEASRLVEDITPKLNDEMARMHDAYKRALESSEQRYIKLEIINAKMNEEKLKNVPHRLVSDDLAVIARLMITDEASAIITNDLAASMKKTPAEVIEEGINSIPSENYSIKSMDEVLKELMGNPDLELPEPEIPMYVCTNEKKTMGSVGIFLDKDLRKAAVEKLEGDFLILPSSIHEVILVPAKGIDPHIMADLINSVNSEEVNPEDVLGTHPYLVNAETLMISNPCMKNEEHEVINTKMTMHM